MKKFACMAVIFMLMCTFSYTVSKSSAEPENAGIYLIEDFNSGYGEHVSASALKGFWSWKNSAMGWPAADAYIELGELCIYANAADAFFFESAGGGAPKEEMANAEYIGFHVSSYLDKEIWVSFYGGGDIDKIDQGEAFFMLNSSYDSNGNWAYLVTDKGEMLASRGNSRNIVLPKLFSGYVIMDISQFSNEWGEEPICLSATSIKLVGVNISAEGVDVESYIAFDNFFICGDGVTHAPGDIAESNKYIRLEADMFYGADISTLKNVNSDIVKEPSWDNSQPVPEKTESSSVNAETTRHPAVPSSTAPPKNTSKITPAPTSGTASEPELQTSLPAGQSMAPGVVNTSGQTPDITPADNPEASLIAEAGPSPSEEDKISEADNNTDNSSLTDGASQNNGEQAGMEKLAAENNGGAVPEKQSGLIEIPRNPLMPLWGWAAVAAVIAGALVMAAVILIKKNKSGKEKK